MTKLSFILYTASNSPNSVQALSNLRKLSSTHLSDHHEIEIVDLSKDPQRGLTDGIIVAPTLVKVGPDLTQTIIGNLSDIPRVLSALGRNSTIKRDVGVNDANLNEVRVTNEAAD